MSLARDMVNVVVADVQPMIRWGLQQYLPEHCRARVLFSASNIDTLLQRLAETPDVDVAIIEMALPGIQGREAEHLIERLQRDHPHLRVLIYSVMGAPLMARAALKLGAHAFVCKRSPLPVLSDAIAHLRNGETFIDPKLRRQRHAGRPLSATEIDIVWRLAHGATVSEIAERTDRSVSTISTHKRNAMLKLGITTDAQLVLAGMLDWLGED
ncbi:Transcriptional regulatory protein RcsB [compost metagenome]